MQYDLQLLANGSQRIEAEGTFFKYRSGAGMIRVTTNKGAVFDLVPGQGVTDIAFSALSIQDRSGAVNVGVLLAGHFTFVDDTINGTMTVTGKVSTVDANADISLAGKAFLACQVAPGGAPATYNNVVALCNPVGSVKNLLVDHVMATITSVGAPGGALRVYMTNGAAASTSGLLSAAILSAVNKKNNGAGSVARLYQDQFAASQIVTYWPGVNLLAVAGPSPGLGAGYYWPMAKVDFEKPVVLTPGSTLVAFMDGGQGTYHTFEFREEPV